MNNIDIDIEKYKKHPRILEVRIMMVLDLFEREYGYAVALKFFESICKSFYCDFQKITGILNKRFEIKKYQKSISSRKLWRQTVIFMGRVYGDSNYKIAKTYLLMSTANLYNQKEFYDPQLFVDEYWLKKLDSEAVLCGIPMYATEALRFLEVIDNLGLVMDRWIGGK